MIPTPHDRVRVIAEIPAERVDAEFDQGRAPRIGDLGAIVTAHPAGTHREPSFSVECVCPEGHTIWLASVFVSELETVASDAGEA